MCDETARFDHIRQCQVELNLMVLVAHPFLPLVYSSYTLPAVPPVDVVQVWDCESRSIVGTFVGHEDLIYRLAIDPSGRRLATGSSDCSVKIWDLETFACLHTFDGPECFLALSWDPFGSRVAFGMFEDVCVYDAISGEHLHTLNARTADVCALASHPVDDLLVSGTDSGTICVWRWSSGELVHKRIGHTESSVYSLAASTSWLVSAERKSLVRVWSWATGECVREIITNDFRLYDLNVLTWKDTILAMLDRNGRTRLWDTSSDDPIEWSSKVLSAKISPQSGVAVLDTSRIACLMFSYDDDFEETTLEVFETSCE